MKKLDAESLFITWIYSTDTERHELMVAVDILYQKHYINFPEYHKFMKQVERVRSARNK